MDLTSSGIMVVLLVVALIGLVNCDITFDEVPVIHHESSVSQDIEYTQIHGSVLVIPGCNAEDSTELSLIRDILTEALHLQGRVFVKVSGRPVGHIQTNDDIESVIDTCSVRQTEDIIEDIIDVALLGDGNVHVYLIIGANQHATGNINTLTEILKEYSTQVDVISVASPGLTGHRVRRQIDLYQLLAQQSGGSVIYAGKNNINSVVDILKQSVKTGQVHILKFITSASPGAKTLFPIDNTVLAFTLQIQTERHPSVAMLQDPAKRPVSFAPGSGHSRQNLGSAAVGTVVAMYELNVTKPADYGLWTMMKMDSYKWDVKITATSPIDFTHDFMEPGPGGFGEYPIKGRPIADATHKLVVTIPEVDKIGRVTMALFVDESNMPLNMFGLTNVGGRRGKSIFYANNTKIPTKPFRVAFEAMDNSAGTKHKIRRVDPMPIMPITIKLSVPSYAGAKFYVNETLTIVFSVVNEAQTTQDVDIFVDDDQLFALDPRFISKTLGPGENKTGSFVLKAGAVPGVTTTVTITAKVSVRGSTSPGQFEVRRFTTEERNKKPEDHIDPTCNITAITGACNIGSDLCACVNQSWSMDVVIGDVGFGLQDMFPTGVSNSSFTHDPFTPGHNISMGAIKATIGGDCCHQTATIQVVDLAGNTAQCTPNITPNFTAPDPALCNKTVPANLTVPCLSVTQSSGKCQADYKPDPCACKTDSWQLIAEFDQVNSLGLHQAFTDGAGNNASLVVKGQKVTVDLDCCHQQIVVKGLDIASNLGQCNLTIGSFPAPKPGDCVSTTTSTTTATTTSTGTSSSTVSGATTASTASGATASSTAAAGSTVAGQTTVAAASTASPAPGASTASPAPGVSTASPAPGVSTASPAPGVSTGSPPATTQAGKPASATTAGGSATTQKPAGKAASSTTKPGASTPVSNTQQNTNPPQTQSSDSSDDKTAVSVTAVAAGLTVAAVAAVVVLVVMMVLFKKALSRAVQSVSPQRNAVDASRDRNRNTRHTPHQRSQWDY